MRRVGYATDEQKYRSSQEDRQPRARSSDTHASKIPEQATATKRANSLESRLPESHTNLHGQFQFPTEQQNSFMMGTMRDSIKCRDFLITNKSQSTLEVGGDEPQLSNIQE